MFDFYLWLATRGGVAITTLLVAGVSATVTGHVPMFLNDVFLWSLRVYSSKASRDASKASRDARELDKRTGIAVFDHPTLFDHSVLMQHFGRPLSFLTKMANVSMWPLSSLARSLKCVPATFDSLKSSCESDLIFVAPDPKFTRMPFRTGAFRVSDDILPVVIHYEPAFANTPVLSHTFAHHVSKTGCPTFYAARVMSPIVRKVDE